MSPALLPAPQELHALVEEQQSEVRSCEFNYFKNALARDWERLLVSSRRPNPKPKNAQFMPSSCYE